MKGWSRLVRTCARPTPLRGIDGIRGSVRFNSVVLAAPTGAQPLDTSRSVVEYVGSKPDLLLVLHGQPASQLNTACSPRVHDESPPATAATPLTEGKVNYAWDVAGVEGAFFLKYAPPYVRSVGPEFPLSQARMDVEAAALMAVSEWAPQHVPRVVLFDQPRCVLCMQRLPPPHGKLVTAITQGHTFPQLPAHLATLLPAYLYSSSSFALSRDAFDLNLQVYSNTDIVQANTAVVFGDPWDESCPSNKNSPQLAQKVAALRRDKVIAQELARVRHHYATQEDALIHNDLHTGNLLVTQQSTYLIDWEFATVGPMAYDIGSIMGNLLLSYFATFGAMGGGSDEQRAWLLDSLASTWNGVRSGLLERHANARRRPAAISAVARPQLAAAGASQQLDNAFADGLLSDSLSYCACVMFRLVAGMHHYPALESILDPVMRAKCEAASLELVRSLLQRGGRKQGVDSIEEVVGLAARLGREVAGVA